MGKVCQEVRKRRKREKNFLYLHKNNIKKKKKTSICAVCSMEAFSNKFGFLESLTKKKKKKKTNPASAHQTALFSDIPEPKINREGNFDILGSPIGSAQHCIDFLTTHAVEPAEETLEAIEMLEDPQIALSLIRQCAGFCQMVHSLRTTPPHELSAQGSRVKGFKWWKVRNVDINIRINTKKKKTI